MKIKNFVIRLLSFFIPFKKYRKMFRVKYSEIDKDIKDIRIDILKYKSIKKNISEIETIVLGSSHARDGFIPSTTEFNLANSSQDLYRIYNLYNWCINRNNNIKNIIIFFDVFHPGLQLEKTQEAWKCVPYKILYDIDYAMVMPQKYLNLEKRLIKKINFYNNEPVSDYRGKSFFINENNKMTASVLVEKHLKNNRRNNNQIKYLQYLLAKASKFGHKVYIVIPPYKKEYTSYLPDFDQVYAELLSILSDVNLLNFQDDNDFIDTDFTDLDHLNYSGAQKLTKKIKNVIYN